MAETMQVSAQRAWTHLKKYQPLIHELVSRDLKVKYRRSFLGYIWSILNPLLMMLLQSIIFSYMFRNDIPNFPLYLICGNTLFTFFNETTSMGLTSVIQNAPLIKKAYIPKFIFPISQAVSRFVTMLFSFGAVLLVMIFTRATFYWTIFLSWLPLVLLFFFSCGLGLLLSALAVYFRDMMHLYSILTMGWMYATPLFYPITALPETLQKLMKLNPLYHYINLFRNLMMYGNIPGPNTWIACIFCAVASMAIGLLVFRKLQKNFILYI